MNSEEIRAIKSTSAARLSTSDELMRCHFAMLQEIAAQLAELNESLKSIAKAWGKL